MKTPLMTALATACVLIAPRAGADTPQEILGASGVQGGLIVHLGGEDEQATVALCVNERLLVHGLFRDARKVQQARRQIHARGLYGRVSADVWNGASLPYADNLVNLVIAEDVETGKLLYENRFFGPVNDKNEPVLDAKNFSIEGVANDILVSDGRTIYLRDTATDLSCNRIDTAKIHLQAMGLSLLDDTWFHRAHWTLSDTMPHRPPRETVFGDLIAFSENRAYAFRSYGTGRTSDYDFSQGYTLTMSSLKNSSLPAVVAERRRSRSDPGSSWECTVDVIAKGMVLTGLSAGEDQSILFLAGPPNVTRPRAIADSLTGKLAGQLLAVAASDGKELARYRLGSIPVFDGLAAAHGKLFVSLRNGEIVCLGK